AFTALGLTVATGIACSSDRDPNSSTAEGGTLAATSAVGSNTTAGGSSTVGTTGTEGSGSPATSGAATSAGGGGASGSSSETASTTGDPFGGNTGSGGEPATGTTGGAGGNTGVGGGETTGTVMTGPLPPVYEVEHTGSDCPVATTFPGFGELPSMPEFPDPFLLESGARMTSRAEWRCRRAEISAQIQHWELGTKPAPTESEVTATFSGNTLTVDVEAGGQSI